MCGFECNLKITFKLSYVIFYLTLTLHLQYTSQCSNCTVLIVYQVTIHKEFSKYLPPESMHTWTHLIVDCSTLS